MTRTKGMIITKCIAFLLALLLGFYAVPEIVYAETADAISSIAADSETKESEKSGDAAESNGEMAKIYEVSELREEYLKTFRQPDGTYVAAYYPTAVHRLNGDGSWEDIDNTLAPSGTEYSTPDARVKFSKKITGNGNIFTLHENNTKITMSLDGAIKKTKGKISPLSTEDESADELSKLMSLENLSSSIMYENILEGIDLEYIVNGNDIKENIIVKEQAEEYIYSFTLKLNNLSARLAPTGDVEIINRSGEKAYVIPAPIIYDAMGVYAENGVGSYELIENDNGSYTLSVTASAEWMNADKRVFPITIDPTITPDWSWEAVTYISSDFPTQSYHYNNSLIAAGSNLGASECIVYWKGTSMINFPKNAYVTDAKIRFHVQSTTNAYVGSHLVTSSWNPSFTYNDHVNVTNPKGSFESRPISYAYAKNSGETVIFDVIEAFRVWKDDPSKNYGLAFKILEPVGDESVTFSGFANVSIDNKPAFTFSYTNLSGLEDYISYSSHSIGNKAVGSVNLATGNLVLQVPTLTTSDSLVSFTPSLYYNSSLFDSYNTAVYAQVPYTESSAGLGFKWNIQQSVIKVSEKDTTISDYYVWSDGDGTAHTLQYGRDTDGLRLLYNYDQDSGIFTITDSQQNIMTFSPISHDEENEPIGWTLTSISDRIGNKMLIEYDLSWRPTDIYIQPNGMQAYRMLGITYQYGSPVKIENFYGEEVVFKYSNEYNGGIQSTAYKYMRRVEYYKNSNATSTLNFTYNQAGMIEKVNETVFGHSVKYEYSGQAVVSVTEYSTSNTQGQKIGFLYGNGHTSVQTSGADDVYGNSDDYITEYVFDKLGRCVSSYSKNAADTKFFGAASGKYETQENIKNNIKESAVIEGSRTNRAINGGFNLYNSSGFRFWVCSSGVSRVLTNENDGDYAAKFNVQPSQTESISQNLMLTGGSYTVSFDMKSANAKGVSVTFSAKSVLGSGLNFTKSFPINTGAMPTYYERVSASFDVPSYYNGGDSVEIKITVTAASDSSNYAAVQIDRLTVNDGSVAADYSMVVGGRFEVLSIYNTGSTSVPLTSFWKTWGQSYSTVESEEQLFSKTCRLYGRLDSEVYAYQTIYQLNELPYEYYNWGEYNNTGRTYLVSGHAKAPDAIVASIASFRLRADVEYYIDDYTTTTVSHYFDFQPYCDDWQLVSGMFTTEKLKAEDGSIISQTVTSITVYCEYSHQLSDTYALFDNISVECCTDTNREKYEYNSAGNVTLASTTTYFEYYEYNGNNDVTLLANNKGELWTYIYADNGNLEAENYYTFTYNASSNYPYLVSNAFDIVTKTPRSKTQYYYDVYGQCVKAITSDLTADADGFEKSIVTSSTYSTNMRIFGALLTETDSLGVTVRFFYDENDGKLLATLNTNTKEGVCYVYDTAGRLTGVRPATYNEASVSYQEIGNAENVAYIYNSRNLLSEIRTQTTTYTFAYDSFGNSSSIKAGNNTLVSYEYNSNNGKLKKLTYGNGLVEEYVYNDLDMISEIWYTHNGVRSLAYSYKYTSDGELAEFNNHKAGVTSNYSYTTGGKLSAVSTYSSGDKVNGLIEDYRYNAKGLLWHERYTVPYLFAGSLRNKGINTVYLYTADGKLGTASISSGSYSVDINLTYDEYNRLAGRVNDFSYSNNYFTNSVSYEYAEATAKHGDTYYNVTTPQVSKYTSTVDGTSLGTSTTSYGYEYDKNGNITRITRGSQVITTYEYDDLGQITRENNALTGKTYSYQYDNSGNITLVRTYSYTQAASLNGLTPTSTDSYAYNNSSWNDRLTSFNGVNITYDAIGNPLTYYNGSHYTFTWRGRQMMSMTKNGVVFEFEYDEAGRRIRETKNGVVTNYYYSGDKLIAEVCGEYLVVYLYDESGSPIGQQYHEPSYGADGWDTFWYEKNLQGDIVALYDESGILQTTHVYDAWGKCTETYHTTNEYSYPVHTPMTYRGYYYDQEYGFYCLGTRFYDPVTRRFINADTHVSLNLTPTILTDKNLFTYCDNNPVMRIDGEGAFWETAFDLVSIAISVVDVCKDPDDAMAWIGLAADAVDLIPFVTGVGETVRAVNTGRKVVDVADDVHDAAKITKKATTGTANEIGKIGESLAGIDVKAKTRIVVNGRTRIPDALNDDVLTEVKNVKYLSNTKQLRDFADYAQQTNRRMDLYIRPTTRVSKSVKDAGWNIKYLW